MLPFRIESCFGLRRVAGALFKGLGRTPTGSGGARASGGGCDSHLRGATRLVRVAPPACDSHSASRTPEARVALLVAASRTAKTASRTKKPASRAKKRATRTPKSCESHFSSLRVALSELRLAPRVALQHVESRRDAVRVGASPLRVAPLGLRLARFPVQLAAV